MATDPNNDSIFWSGGKYYYMSTCVSRDEGWSWTRHDVTLTEGWTYALAVDPFSSDIVYAGGIPCVFKTTDAGTSWMSCSLGITGYAHAIAIDPVDNNLIFAGTDNGIFKSTDGGTSWSLQASSQVNALLINPVSPDTMFAGTDSGVLQSTDHGETWVFHGLEREYVRELFIDPDHYVYAGTYGSGVFRWEMQTSTKEVVTDRPRNTHVAVFPNPFSGRVALAYELSTGTGVTVSFYDVTGRHVHTITKPHHAPGHYTIYWDGKDSNGKTCAPGVYFYRMIIQEKTVSGTLLRL